MNVNNDNRKICPLSMANPDPEKTVWCERSSCAWWVEGVYSTERLRQPGLCAIEMIAIKNSDGKIPV